jgi:hypothetical protein
MELADDLIALAERLQRSYGPPVLAVRVASELPVRRLRARTREAVDALAGGELYWSVDVEPSGVIVRQWGHAPDIRATLRALAQKLGDLDGSLVAHEPEPEVEVTPLTERGEELLECHLRACGERRLWVDERKVEHAKSLGREPPAPQVTFFPDESALLAGVKAALAWVGTPPPGARLRSPSGPHRDIEEVGAHVAKVFADAGRQRWRISPRMWWESDEAFRLSFIDPDRGDVSLTAGGAGLARGEWARVHGALLDELRVAADWASYGLIKRGRQVSQVGHSLRDDWVPAFHFGSHNLDHFIYEDVLAPDAFGAQLLGAGYAARVPDGEDWERLELADDAVLLLHRDPAAWFAEPLPPISPEDGRLRNPSPPTPEVILEAREDLAAILITPDILSALPLDPLADR